MNSRKILLLAVLLTPGLVGLAQPFTPGFGGSYSIGYGGTGIAAGDMNGDGWDDIVTATEQGSTLRVWLNNGTGGFLNTGQVPAIVGLPQQVALGDLDGDGDLDVVVCAGGGHALHFNNGAGVLTPVSSASSGDHHDVVVKDLDGQNGLDIVLCNFNTNSASVLLSNGTGGFTAQPLSLGGNAQKVAAGDVDGDGDLDLAFTWGQTYAASGCSIFLNNGSGGFALSPTSPLQMPSGQRANALAFGDLDADGDLDLIVANDVNTAKITVWANNGSGIFSPGAVHNFNGVPYSIVIADFDLDQNLDIAVALGEPTSSFQIRVFQNAASTSLLPAPLAITQSGTAGIFRICEADVDRNSVPDLAAVTFTAGDMRIVLNGATPPPSRTYTFTLPCTVPGWIATPVAVSAGETIAIHAAGSFQVSANATTTADGMGNPHCGTTSLGLLGRSESGLMARVGGNGPLLDDGRPFAGDGTYSVLNCGGATGGPYGAGFVGSRFVGTAPASGALFLGINDSYFPDNSGSLTIHAHVRAANPHPGSSGDLELRVAANGPGVLETLHTIAAGDTLRCEVTTPAGSLANGLLFLGFDFLVAGQVPAIPGVADVHINPFTTFFLIDPTSTGGFPPATVGALGTAVQVAIPAGLAGNEMMVQAFVIGAAAAPLPWVATDAHQVIFY